MKLKIPGTAKEIVENLIIEEDYSVRELANMLGITPKTVYRIRKGHCPHPKIHLNLIQLFLVQRREKTH